MKLALVALVIAVLVAIPMVHAVRRYTQRAPASRPYLLAGAVAILIGSAFALPRLDRIIPPSMRESPAGLLPALGAMLGLGFAVLAAVAVMLGVMLSRRSDRDGEEQT